MTRTNVTLLNEVLLNMLKADLIRHFNSTSQGKQWRERQELLQNLAVETGLRDLIGIKMQRNNVA